VPPSKLNIRKKKKNHVFLTLGGGEEEEGYSTYLLKRDKRGGNKGQGEISAIAAGRAIGTLLPGEGGEKQRRSML